MDNNILNIEQAIEFLGVSEKTLIKLLREEHIPARKIGREWRFSKQALIDWLSTGDSTNYISKSELYQVSKDEAGTRQDILDSICEKISNLRESNSVEKFLTLEKNISIPDNANLRVSYKQQRDVEKLEFKIYWTQRDEYKIL